jgi:alpha-aminoadipic semialdehyde synthase
MRIGIRREDKNEWEARAPLTPKQVGELILSAGLEFTVQPSRIRVFPDAEYRAAGARISDDLSDCPLIAAVKEIPVDLLEPGKTYLFFSHTIKGQKANMSMLRRLMELGCQLIDYEKITDDAGQRLIFFGRHAGLAGMVDTLWALGRRLKWEGLPTPLEQIEQALRYPSSVEAKRAVAAAGQEIRRQGLPDGVPPLVVGFAGYGHVSQGAQEVFDQLSPLEITPNDLESKGLEGLPEGHRLYKVVFKEEHMVEPGEPGARFVLQEYYDHPERYRGRFSHYLDYLTVLVNCIYWDSRYPRLVTKARLKRMFAGGVSARLRVLSDITCDVGGSIECNVRCADSGNPVYVYDPVTGEAADGVAGRGPVVLAVDNLPCELPRESSADFGAALLGLLPDIAGADFTDSFARCNLPAPIKRATILYKGELTPEYQYLEKYL